MNKRLVAVWTILALALGVLADDWPQWGGPNRDNVSQEKGLAKKWPGGGPQQLWKVGGLGEGFSSVAVVGDTIFTTGMENGQGRLYLISTSGRVIGRKTYGDETKGGGYPGPRGTPTVADGRVFVESGEGVLTCFRAKDGQIEWRKDLFDDLGGQQLQWSVAESVLVDGNRVICTPGGSNGTLVALDARNGQTIWRCMSRGGKSAYCSPILVDHNGRKIIVTMVEEGAIGVDAKDGRELWFYQHKNKYSVHAATPVYYQGRVVISSGYGMGAECLEMNQAGTSVRKVWENKELANHHGGIVGIDGAVVGTGDRGLVCIDIMTGRVNWTDRAVGKGSITAAGGQLYVYGENGQVGLVDFSAKQFTGLAGRFNVNDGSKQHWAHPVVANGVLYIRHGDTLIAYKVSE